MHFLIYLILFYLIAYYSVKAYLKSIAHQHDDPDQVRFRWRGSFLRYLLK